MPSSEVERKLHEAAARSPEIAAMLAAKRDDASPRYRRLALLVGGGAAAVGALWIAVMAIGGAREKQREPAEEIDTSHYLSPFRTAAGEHGEQTAPFSGFAVSVDTDPPGGLVTIAGVPRGEAPVLANFKCKPGAKLEIRAELAGFRPGRRQVACRADTLVKLTIPLRN